LKDKAEQGSEKKARRKILTRRNFLFTTAGIGLSGIAAGGYGFGIEPNRVKIRRQIMKIQGLPEVFEGMKLVQLADIHFQTGRDETLMENVVEAVNKLDADVILHTGDYVARDTNSLQNLAEYFEQLKCKQNSYAILGNHDVWHGTQSYYKKYFDNLGIRLLINQSTEIKRGNESLSLVGLDSAWAGKPDIKKAFYGISEDRVAITMMHEPDYFDEIVKFRQNFFQISGHTHGGQCRVPFVKYAPVKVKYGEKYIDGYYTREEGQQLFVSSGIGTSGLRVRFSCVPEVVLMTLQSS